MHIFRLDQDSGLNTEGLKLVYFKFGKAGSSFGLLVNRYREFEQAYFPGIPVSSVIYNIIAS